MFSFKISTWPPLALRCLQRPHHSPLPWLQPWSFGNYLCCKFTHFDFDTIVCNSYTAHALNLIYSA